MNLKAAVRKINTKLHGIGNYHRDIPLDVIFEACKEQGVVPVQEDGSEWSGILCGAGGRAHIDLMIAGQYLKECLHLIWHKMPGTGNYEVIAYVS